MSLTTLFLFMNWWPC